MSGVSEASVSEEFVVKESKSLLVRGVSLVLVSEMSREMGFRLPRDADILSRDGRWRGLGITMAGRGGKSNSGVTAGLGV